MSLRPHAWPIVTLSLLVSTSAIASPESATERANKVLATIQTAKPLKNEHFTFLIDEHVSGELKRRTYEGGLQRIMLSSAEPDGHGDGWTDFYYIDGNLIYASEHSDYWSFVETSEVGVRSELNIVFDAGSCVQQMRKSAKSIGDGSNLNKLMKEATAEPETCGTEAIELAALGSRMRTVRSKRDRKHQGHRRFIQPLHSPLNRPVRVASTPRPAPNCRASWRGRHPGQEDGQCRRGLWGVGRALGRPRHERQD